MRKKISLLIAGILVISTLFGCGGDSSVEKDVQEESNQKSSEDEASSNPTGESAFFDELGDDTYEIEIYTNANGTSTYVLGVALADLINQNSTWLRATAMESPGPDETAVAILNDKNMQKHAIGYTITLDALLGDAPFSGPNEDLRIIAGYGLVSNLYMTTNPELKTLSDLEGKRVALGTQPNIPRVTMQEKMFELMGINCEFEYMTFGDAVTALSDGKVDALIGGGFAVSADASEWTPNPAMAELLARGTVNYISMDEEYLLKAKKELKHELLPGIITVDGGQYDENWSEPLTIMADYLCWGCHKDMPNEVVTEICTIMGDNAEKFVEYVRNGGYISLDNMAKLDTPEYIHPAAEAFYKERGIEVNTRK